MFEVRRYSEDYKDTWNEFVRHSKNGTFLFDRNYMDYHSDRFCDHSLLFYNKNTLCALLPANVNGDTLYSHQGLTYGGFVLDGRATVENVLTLFQQTIDYLRNNSIHTFFYKQMPTCYHAYPSEEDEYALWRLKAELSVCNISTAIALNTRFTIPFERRRRRGIARAALAGYTVRETRDIGPFWKIMEENLWEKYGAKPLHTIEEMTRLMSAFPKEIKCYVAEKGGRSEAGAVIYLTQQTVHVQYAHATPTGKNEGTLDFLYDTLISKSAALDFRYFDIGTSNENGGQILNSNLIAQKEGFGARGIAYKQWTLHI